MSGVRQASVGPPARERGSETRRPEPPERSRALAVLGVWCVLGIATAVAVAAAGASSVLAAFLVALAVVTGALGWYAAERARV